ncbi:MAG: hypothetical protein J6F30_08065 [Cellulosilyticum sp.]|nr:hypothetical protein [Cellulosilyticum sp.]
MYEIEGSSLIDSLVKTLSEEFDGELTVYDGKITQNLEEPCIMITEDRVRSKDELHDRRMEDQVIEFEIHCKNKNDTASDEDTEIWSYTRKIAHRLRNILPLITAYKYNDDRTNMVATDNSFRGFNFWWQVDNGKGYVYMTYKYRTIYREDLDKIQNLDNDTHIKQ